MTKKAVIASVAAAVAFLAAAPARAEIGSIISSFRMEGDYGIHREGNYVYTFECNLSQHHIRKYTLSGGYQGRVRIYNSNPYPLRSGSRTHLGAGYVALCDNAESQLKIFRLSGGSPVSSFRVIVAYNVFWTGEHYYVNGRSEREIFRYYTSSGSRAGTWTCSGWSPSSSCGGAEYAQRGNKGEGPYFVGSPDSRSSPLGMTTFPGGSLVKSWREPSGTVKHLAYGDSSNPGVYGAAIWAILDVPDHVIEIDIDARGASGVLPASLGKVKAIYR